LFDDSKVGESFNEQILPNLYKEADDRYKLLKPPGFKDAEEKRMNGSMETLSCGSKY
jgi:hypothetical protein